MSKKHGNLLGIMLEAIGNTTGFFKWPPEGTNAWVAKQIKFSRSQYYRYHNAVSYLKKKGLVQTLSRNGQKFLKLTSHGQLELLLQKFQVKYQKKWDKKWRVVIFDIPEDCRDKRDLLRGLLKRYGFLKLQASVFLNPYPLNREAISYLQQAGLMSYIRILRVDELDNQNDLLKKFNLKI